MSFWSVKAVVGARRGVFGLLARVIKFVGWKDQHTACTDIMGVNNSANIKADFLIEPLSPLVTAWSGSNECAWV